MYVYLYLYVCEEGKEDMILRARDQVGYMKGIGGKKRKGEYDVNIF